MQNVIRRTTTITTKILLIRVRIGANTKMKDALIVQIVAQIHVTTEEATAVEEAMVLVDAAMVVAAEEDAVMAAEAAVIVVAAAAVIAIVDTFRTCLFVYMSV